MLRPDMSNGWALSHDVMQVGGGFVDQFETQHPRALDALWLFLMWCGCFVIWRASCEVTRLRRLHRATIADVDNMDGPTFAAYLAYMFRRLGFKVKMTTGFGTYGAQMMLTKPGIRCAVQARRVDSWVDANSVQDLVASRDYYYCHMALIVTSGGFSDGAQAAAARAGVELWDRKELMAKMALLEPYPISQPAVLSSAPDDGPDEAAFQRPA